MKPNEVFYVGGVEVIQNPTNIQTRQLTDEVMRERPMLTESDYKVRLSRDDDGNEYVWKATEACHEMINRPMEKILGVKLRGYK